MKMTSHQVSDSLFLVRQEVGKKAPAKPAEVPVNHVAVIDCSGSMSSDLPKIREQIKKRIPKLLGDKDTLSIIWFSGRGQFGALLEAEPVSTLADLQEVNKAVDRWLRPVGLTGFKEPMEEAAALVARVGKKNKNPFALFFMSDGCDNQWSRQEILKATEKTAGGLASATFVEYGYYADRPLLTAMAEKAGGSLIFSEDFDRYVPLFESAIQRKVSGAPRVEISVPGDVVGGFAFSMRDGELLSFEVAGGKAHVPEDLPEVWFLAPSAVGKAGSSVLELSRSASRGPAGDEVDAVYAAVSLFSLRAQPKILYPLLKALGDVRLIEAYGGCFGKQKYTEFMEASKAAAFGEGRFSDGWDPDRVPREDAFTVLDLLRLLSSDDGNRVLLDHEKFSYNRISRARLDADENLTAEEQQKVQELSQRIASEKDVKKLKALNDELSAITASKRKALRFESSPSPDGYSISNLTFNEERPNVSVLVRKEGTVDLSERLPGSGFEGKIPEKFGTFVFRKYAIIRDGLINVDRLPVALTDATRKELEKEISSGRAKAGLLGREDGVTVINLRGLPVVNRAMVKSVSAEELFRKEWELTKARAVQKVLNTVRKEKFPTVSEGFKEQYGEEAANWLKEQGITDYSGFGAPKTVQAEATDFYMGKELKVSIKGYSSLPSLSDVRKRIASGKVTSSAALMVPAIEELDKFLSSREHTAASDQDASLRAWIDSKFGEAQKSVRQLIFEMSQIRFGVIVGQVWFTEFSSIEEDSLTIRADGQELQCKAEQREVKVEI